MIISLASAGYPLPWFLALTSALACPGFCKEKQKSRGYNLCFSSTLVVFFCSA
jgi:hypothetical protein